MKHLVSLFKLVELTRSQPQYGYTLSGIRQNDLSNLAEHHYLVTFMAWQLARQVKNKGADISIEKVLEFSLVHDLGELFGGDISMPYARANPKAKKFAKAFEEENQRFMARFFGDDLVYFQELGHEILDTQTDEGIISKIADYIEVTYFKQYMNQLTQFDVDLIKPKLQSMVEKMQDPVAKKELFVFVQDWVDTISEKSIPQILYEHTEDLE